MAYSSFRRFLVVASVVFISATAGLFVASCGAPPFDYQWLELQPMQYARRAHAAASHGEFLYVIGGVDEAGRYVTETEFTRVQPDGRIESWQSTTPLPQGRIYHAAVTLNGYVYVLGGGQGELGDNNMPVVTVERAPILPRGALGAWERQPDLATPRRGLQVVAHDNTLYAIGGYDGTFLKSVERAQLTASGALSSWTLEPAHAVVDRYIHSATLAGATIYLLGGHVQGSQQMSYGDVESSRIGTGGVLSQWTVEKTRLRAPRFMASAFSIGDYLYMLGGHSGDSRLNSVEFARIESGGRVAQWRYTTAMTVGRGAAAVIVRGDTVYVTGGSSDRGVSAHVEMAQQDRNGHLGNPRTRLRP